jgi:hypothetical protein
VTARPFLEEIEVWGRDCGQDYREETTMQAGSNATAPRSIGAVGGYDDGRARIKQFEISFELLDEH